MFGGGEVESVYYGEFGFEVGFEVGSRGGYSVCKDFKGGINVIIYYIVRWGV